MVNRGAHRRLKSKVFVVDGNKRVDMRLYMYTKEVATQKGN